MPETLSQGSTSMKRPKLHDGVWYYRPPDKNVKSMVLLLGPSALSLEETLFMQLVPLLDGELTTDEILEQISDEIAPEKAVACLEKLAKRRIIYDAVKGANSSSTERSPGTLRVGIQTLGAMPVGNIPEILQRSGLRPADSPDEADFNVVVTDHYLRPELEDINKGARKPWLLLGPNGHEMWIGPLFIPGETACWACLAHRLRLNRRVEQHIWHHTGGSQIPPKVSDLAIGAAATAYEMAAAQIASWQKDPDASPIREQLSAFDPVKLKLTRHPVLRRPQCPSCGSSEVAAPQPVRLLPSPKTGSAGGTAGHNQRGIGLRNAGAEATLRKYAKHVSPVTGLVTALTKTSNAPGIHVFKGGRYTAQTSATWSHLQSALNEHASGKGMTEAQAKASALAETLEWYSMDAAPNCKTAEETFTRLSAHERVLSPEDLTHFSANQLSAAQDAASKGETRPKRVPDPFDPDHLVDWRPVWSMTAEDWVHIPAAFCNSSLNCPFISANSNGVAAGTSLEDAIIHGFNELVERDAVALWWYNMAARPAVALDGLDPNFLAAMRDYQSSLGRDFWLLDITTDLGIPSFAGISVDETGGGSTGFGFGAHSDPYVAATRALTELNQLLPVSGQFVPRADRPAPAAARMSEALDQHLRPASSLPPSRLDHYTFENRADIAEDVEAAVEHMRGLGLEFLVADLTQPDVELPVAKVIIPGLRHAYPEFAPGRLYDIPVKLGWRDTPVLEEEISNMESPL